MRVYDLSSILDKLKRSSENIEASEEISTDDLMTAAQLPADLDEDRVHSMITAMLSLGERTAEELERGGLRQVLAKGDNGYVLMIHAGSDAIVTVVTDPNAEDGQVFLDARRVFLNATRVAENITKLV